MMIEPKGIKYWRDSPDGNVIDKDAPDWAKKEFNEYMKKFNASSDGERQEDGSIVYTNY